MIIQRKVLIKIIAVVVAMAVLAVLLAGCSSDLTGKWTSDSGSGSQISFSSTGRVVMASNGAEVLSGTYTTDNGRLVMTLTDANGDVHIIEATYKIEGKKLFLTNGKGLTEVFVR